AAIFLMSCSKTDDSATPMNVSGNNPSNILDEYEKAGLLSLVENLKFQKDVYIIMSQEVQTGLFDELCLCDGEYLDILLTKVDKYGLVNPVIGKGTGEFGDLNIQARYDDFVSTSQSYNSMLNYAKQMEEYLVIEVEASTTTLDGNQDIEKIYAELLADSKDHIEILISELEAVSAQTEDRPTVNEF
ncbi:MAG: DUF2202 domain-containing protein, partial [Bacteroidales bacterium]|nr:DUF2202 domain-containing protein [Bacteroidales bacterium]